MMNDVFGRNLRRVGLTHVILVCVLIGLAWVPRWFKPKKSRDLEFTVDVRGLFEPEVTPAPPTEVPAPPDRADIPEEAPPPKPKPKPKPPEPKPKPKPPAPKPVVPPAPRPNPLTPEQVQALLMQGAKPSDHTSIPADEEDRYLAQIKNSLYAAWVRPGAEALGAGGVQMEIRFDGTGRLTDRTLKRSSGNTVMDNSVMDAVKSVQSIPGLPTAFLEKFSRLTITFELDDEN